MASASLTGETIWTRDFNGVEQEDIWDDSALIDAYDRAVGQVKEAIAKKMSEDASNIKKKKPRPKKVWKVGDFCNTVYSEDGLNYEAYIKEISESGTNCLVQYIGYGNEEVVPITALQPSLGKEIREQQDQFSQKEISLIEAATTNLDNSTNSIDYQQRSKNKKTKSPSEKSHHSHRKSKKSSQSLEPQYSCFPPAQPVCFHSVANQSFHTPAQWPGSFNFPSTSQRIPPPPPFPMDQETVKDDEALAAMLMSWYMSGYHTGFYQGMKQQQNQGGCQSCKCYTHMQR